MHRDLMSAGYRIFGLHPIVDGKCGCRNKDCKAVGKHPFAASWQHTPLWSNDQILKMEEAGQFTTGYGVLVDGLLVIDVDARNGGVDSFQRLLEDIPSIKDAGLVVNTGSGGGSQHLYYKVSNDLALQGKHDNYKGIDFKSSGFVVGIGSQHKSGGSYEIDSGSIDSIGAAPQELIELLKKQDRRRVLLNDKPVDISSSEVADMLSYINPDVEYDVWVRIGMAIHHVMNGDGFATWDKWSSDGEKYSASEMDSKWFSFGKTSNPVGMGTLLYYAELAGYEAPVDFSSTDEVSPEVFIGDLPCDISDVDLLRPPGFVGSLTAWVNNQCRYPRENLAVGAAISAMGNVIGLKYTDGYSGASSNMFTFCVAASSTGKEAVLQATSDIHRFAGIAGACHGTIKSEQEITRNLIQHQAAIYVLDEVGILLQKINNASVRGGASYLEGVIGLLMSAYSKSDSFMPLSGDVRRDAESLLLKELSSCTVKIEENADKNGKYSKRKEQVEHALENLSSGLERPFLSLIGYTTPTTFEDLVTKSSISNGFIGRSILINERETNPRAKRRFKKTPMADTMKNTLSSLYNAGNYDSTASRIEFIGDKIVIPSEEDAMDLLDRCLDWIEEYAEQHKEMSGLEAAIRRGFEQIVKISFILATASGVRTVQHVRWALAFAHRDINEKTMLAYANEHKDSKKDGAKVLTARILANIDRKTGVTVATLANRLRKSSSDIEKTLGLMGNQVVSVETIHSRNKTTSIKYFTR